jgi:hypothetical protein
MYALTKRALAEAGKPLKPDRCHRCGQTKGIIEYHNRNYDHPTKYLEALCFRCHMAVHCKWRVPAAVKKYFQLIAEGYTFPPVFTRNFWIVRRDHGF